MSLQASPQEVNTIAVAVAATRASLITRFFIVIVFVIKVEKKLIFAAKITLFCVWWYACSRKNG
jgi:hypothetical protein